MTADRARNPYLDAALGYAERGWAVFPVHGVHRGRCTCGHHDCASPGKHPVVRRGVHEATTDQQLIHRWWRGLPAANIGVATGERSGIVVIDVDLGPRTNAALGSPGEEEQVQKQDQRRMQAEKSLHVITTKLPSTLTALTGGGGRHLLLVQLRDQVLHNHTNRLPGIDKKLPGIDLRADGGYFIAPPSVHVSGNRYEWLDPTVPIADAPAWLREPERRPIYVPTVPTRFDGDGTRVGLKVMRKQLAILARAREGERNDTLNRCAFVVARYVGAGHLLESAARAELTRVGLAIGLTSWETSRTVDSAFGSVFGRSARRGLRAATSTADGSEGGDGIDR
jgi:hypothetical protein